MHPAAIFDKVHSRVRELQSRHGAVSSVSFDAVRGRAPVATGFDYVADFHLVGRRVLRERWPRKYQMFELYFVGRTPYREAIAKLKVPAGTFDRWSVEVRTAVGRQLRTAGLYPPRHYGQRSVTSASNDSI